MHNYHRQDRQRNSRTVSIKAGNPMQMPAVGFSSPNFSCMKVTCLVLDSWDVAIVHGE